MPDMYESIPLDLELLRVGLHMDESYAIMRYELKGHDRDYYCLVRDAESQGPFSLNEYTALTTGFLSEYQGDEGITCFVRGDLTFLEKFDAHTLNANSPFSVQQRRNIQMAFDNLEPGMCLEAARAFAERDIDSWTAFEVCAAMRDYFPKQLIEPLLDEGRSHLQVRELRHLAESLLDDHGNGTIDNRLADAYLVIATHREFSPEKIDGLRRAIVAAKFQFDPVWLSLNVAQLGSVLYALRLGVPFEEVRAYGDGRFTAEAIDVITNAYMSLSDSGREYLPLIMKPEFTPDQLYEAELALDAFDLGTIDLNALNVVINPSLPQPVMEALRGKLCYCGLRVEDARMLVEQGATADQIRDFIEGGGEPAEDAAQQEPHGNPEAERGSLRDAAKEQREASGQLSRSEEQEAQDIPREEKE